MRAVRRNKIIFKRIHSFSLLVLLESLPSGLWWPVLPRLYSDKRSATKREWLLRGHLNFSTRSTKRLGGHKTEFLFRCLPAAVCSHVVFTWHCLLPVLEPYMVPTCGAQAAHSKKKNNNWNFSRDGPPTSKSPHTQNPITNISNCKICRPALAFNFIKGIYTLPQHTLPTHTHPWKLSGSLHCLWLVQCNKTTTARSLWGWKWTQR